MACSSAYVYMLYTTSGWLVPSTIPTVPVHHREWSLLALASSGMARRVSPQAQATTSLREWSGGLHRLTLWDMTSTPSSWIAPCPHASIASR